MSDITREEFDKVVKDLTLVKNDVNTIKTHTQLQSNILSVLNSNDLQGIVFSIANSEKLCKALLICKNRTTASDLCKALSIKPQNIRRDILDKLINNSLLTVCDEGKINTYIRVGYLDLIGFDKLAINKYPNLR